MGISILSDELAPIPRKVVFTFRCDGPSCVEHFARVADYVAFRREACRAGWVERFGGSLGRAFYCAKCA